MKKTTPKQFQEFKNEVLRLQPIIGLNDWQIFFNHEKKEGVFATTTYSRVGAVGIITFNLELHDNEFSDLNIKRTALHECLHLLLADLFCMAENREFDSFLLNQAEEKLIRRLEKLTWN